jgi:hypothetical protein
MMKDVLRVIERIRQVAETNGVSTEEAIRIIRAQAGIERPVKKIGGISIDEALHRIEARALQLESRGTNTSSLTVRPAPAS